MPLEIRRIEYSEIELRHALALYQAKTEGGQATQGRVSAIRVTGGEEFNIVAKVSCPKTHEVVRKVFDHPTSVAVMVLFSKQAGIPLPRQGRKAMAPTQFGGVAMTVRYDHKVCEAMPSAIQASQLGQSNLAATVHATGHA